MFFVSSLLAFAASPYLVHAAPAPAAACENYVVPGIDGSFNERIYTDFKAITTKQAENVESFLYSAGYHISDYPIEEGPIKRRFDANNVQIINGVLEMKVNAYNKEEYTVGAEIFTREDFKYGSVRTVQKSSSVAGVCEGNFLYANATQETDWEVLTSTIDVDSKCVPKGIWATNQAVTENADKTSETFPLSFDPREDFHEYRIDWIPDATIFYVDGVEMTRITTNVPSASGPWMWNVWSNGDPCWTGAPPTQDSITQIQSIELYKGYSLEISASDACEI